MRRQIVEQRAVRHRDTVRETRRAAAVLKIAGLVGLLFGERRDGGGACRELAPVDRLHLALLGGLDRHRGDFGRKEQHFGIAARELDDELANIAVAPAEARRQRQRSEEHMSELQSLMRISYAVFCLNKNNSYYFT